MPEDTPTDVEEEIVDEELVNLLEQISTEEEPEEPEEPEIPPDPKEQTEPELKDNEIETPEIVTTTLAAKPEGEDVMVPLKQLAVRFSETIDVVFENSKKDRNDIQEVIDYCKGVVNGQGKIPEVVMQSWVTAATSKADINIGTTKLLDSIAKLLAAAKNNNILLEVNIDGNEDLEALLNQDTRFDEED